jgi:hypothetical protein
MFFKDSSNNRYYLGRQFTYNNIQYAAAAATEAKFTALGLTKVTLAAKPDQRFYSFTGPDISGAYSSTARDLADLKANFIAETKKTERELLSGSDYYIIQNTEDSSTYPIPSEVSTYRSDVRTAATARCSEITAITTVAALKTLIDGTGFTQFPDAPTTNYTAF